MINRELRTPNRALGRTILTALIILLAPALSWSADFTASTLGDYGNVTVMDVTGNYDARNADGSDNDAARQAVAKEFYRTHKDEYDFLFIFSNFNYQMPTDARAFYHGVRNDVSGIGMLLFDNSGLYNDSNVSGRLQGTIDMGNIALLVTDPMDPKFNETLYIMSHEIMHRWSAYAKFKDASGSESSALLGRESSHWSFLLDSGGSLMYGNKWQNNGNGTFTSVAPQTELKYYSPLDLYLMGMLDKSQVPPMLLIENNAIDPARLPEANVTISGQARTVTIDDIIAAMGERVPSAAASQKSFKTAFIFLTRPGTFTGQEIYGIENIRNGAVTRFSVLTDGRSIMEVASTPKEDVQVNPGVLPPSTTLRPMANIDEGVTWLIGKQSTDGSWMDLAQTMERDTAEAVLTLKPFPAGQTNVQSGMLWLGISQSLNVDYLCRKIEAFVAAGADTTELVRELLERRNSDGGWGSGRTYSSNAADTALALKALSLAGAGEQQAISNAIQYLLSAQKSVGGWTGNGESTVQATTAALSALNRYRTSYPMGDAISRGTGWLLSKQVNGAFGHATDAGQEATVYDTALAVLVLRELDAATNITNPAVDFLKARQDQNGSWNSSVFETALAVQAILKGNIDPDLVVRSSDITFTPDRISALPASVVINVSVSNTGMTEVRQAQIVLYDGAVAEANRIGQPVVVAVPGQSPAAVTFSTTISDGNEHTFIAVVTSLDIAKESNENNNRAGRSLQVQTTYDLEVLPGDVSVSPATASLLQDVTITAKIGNKGTMTAYSVPVKFFVTAPGGAVTIAEVTVDVPANGSVMKSVNWRANRAGVNMPVTVQVDPDNYYKDELSETNNSASTLVTINSLTEPNISISYKDLVVTPPTLLEGGSAVISAIVRNDGGSAVSGVVATFYSTVSGTMRQLPLDAPAAMTIPPLEPGQNAVVSLTWNNIPDPGNTIITVRASPPGGTSEIRTDDNEAFTTVSVKSLPELMISTNAVVIQPAFPKEGDPVTISVTVQNSGDQEAANVIVRAMDGGSPIGPDQTITMLSGHTTATVGFSYGTTVSKGAHEITVVVDPLNSITERNKENNRAARSFGVQDADLFVTERYFSPNGDGVKDATELFFRLPSPQSVTVVVMNKRGETVRTFSGFGPQNIGAGSVRWDGLDNDEMIVDDGEYRFRLKDASGVTMSESPVTVDTNRLPLPEAFGTKYLLNTTLTCQLPALEDWRWLPDESGIVAQLPQTQSYPNGIYTISPDGVEITRLVPWDWNKQGDGRYAYSYFGFDLSPDGEKIAFILHISDKQRNIQTAELWTVHRDGSNLNKIDTIVPEGYNASGSIFDVKWSPAGNALVYRTSGGYAETLRIAGPAVSGVNVIETGGWYDGNYIAWSPDGARLAYAAGRYEGWYYIESIKTTDLIGPPRQVFPDIREAEYTFTDSVAWLNSGKLIVSVWGYGSVRGIWLVTPDGGSSLIAGTDTSYRHRISLSPGGQFFSFTEEYDEGRLFITDENGNISTHTVRQGGPYCSPRISDVVWSADGGSLAFSEELATCGDCTNQCQDTVGPRVIVINAASKVEQSYATPMTPVAWPQRGGYLLGTGSGIESLQLSTGQTGSAPLAPGAYIPYQQTTMSPQERYLTYSQQIDDTNPCWRWGQVEPWAYSETELWALSSALNLTADLRAVKRKTGIILRGIAGDLNFEGYRLEYADAKTPQAWTPVLPPADREVLNEVFTTWIPPVRGAYYVRLTAWDKAGNTAQSTKRISWAAATSISNIRQSTPIFSPFNEMVGTVDLSYQVLEPVNLEFQVFTVDNELIKTIVMSHPETGTGMMSWDGRNEQDVIVPDGKYIIKVLDLEFPVEVDNTSPEATVNLSLDFVENPLKVMGEIVKKWRLVASYEAQDANLSGWKLDIGKGDNPQQWESLDGGTEVAKDGRDGFSFGFNYQDIERIKTFIGRKLRITVEDRAGNKRVASSQVLPERLIADAWDYVDGMDIQATAGSDAVRIPTDKAQPGIHSIAGFQTIDSRLVSMNVQYTLSFDVLQNNGNIWTDDAVVPEPSTMWFAQWDNSSFKPYQAYAVRLKAVDSLDRTHFSNVLYHELFKLSESCNAKAPLVGEIALFEPLVMLSLDARERPNDPKLPWTDADRYKTYDASKGDRMPKGYFEPPLPTFAVEPGKKYEIRMTGIGASGREYAVVINYPGNPCDLSIPLNVTYAEAQECGTASDKASIISAEINTNDMMEEARRKNSPRYLAVLEKLKKNAVIDLSYYLDDSEGLRLLRRIDDPREILKVWLENHGTSFEIANADLAEGRHPIVARLQYRDIANNMLKTAWARGELLVDRALPESVLTSPAPAASICPLRVPRKSGTRSYLQVNGIARDVRNIPVERYDGTGTYKLTMMQGLDPANPSGVWVPALGLVNASGSEGSDDDPAIRGSASESESQLGLVNVYESGQDLTIRLEAISNTGNKSCSVTSARALPSATTVNAQGDRTIISSTGNVNAVTATYSVSESARVDVSVFRVEKDPINHRYYPVPPVIRTLIANEQYTGGTRTVLWNGLNDGNAPVMDGRYGIIVQATNSCGNTAVGQVEVEVDNTPPVLSISSPGPGAVGKIVHVTGIARDDHFQQFKLEALKEDGTGLSLVSQGTQAVKDTGVLGKWYTFGLENGPWVLQLTATDTVGNESTVTSMVTVGNDTTLFGRLALSPDVISPNGNYRAETTKIDYELAQGAQVEIAMLDAGNVVRKSVMSSASAAGSFSLVYDGTDSANGKLPDGEYKARLTAALLTDPSVVQTEVLPFKIDTIYPVVNITSPKDASYLSVTALPVTGTVSDENLAEYALSYTGAAGRLPIDGGNQSRTGHVFGTVDAIPEGDYRLEVKAKDLGENETIMNMPFTIDRTPPSVKLETPKDGGYFGGEKNIIAISGSLVEKNLESFSLRYGSGDSPALWTDLVSGTTVTAYPSSFAWKIGKHDGIPDGSYTLSLAAKDKAGLAGEARVRVTIDNTPPAVAITAPQEGGTVRTGADIRGTASDANLDRFVVEMSEGMCSAAYKWAAIRTGASTVQDGVLAQWPGATVDGDYCLRVTATDKTGNAAFAVIGLKVDTTPPAPPVLDGTRQNAADVRLTWSGNTESDLAGFNVYRGGQKLNAGPTVTAGEFIDAGLGEGSYVYTVRALDLAGNESGPSNAVKVRIDLTGPAAKIARPFSGSKISGFIEIKGTAFSADDFKQYRISIGQGIAPAAWTVIRTSPLAVSNGVLADLDTLGHAEGQTFSLRLEAEDLAGNITTDNIAITIDNTPPRAPVLALPVVDGASVTLQWSESPDAYLAGYLLFVNDRLVNAPSSMTQADMTPYLIPCPTYYHYDLPDGTFTYVVAAVDQAGNMNLSQTPVVATIDTRAPQIAIVAPVVDQTGHANIGGKTLVRAESPDLDIDHVTFYYSVSGSNTWYSFGVSRQAPYEAAFTPAALDTTYDLKAEAVDKHVPLANLGVSPVITVTYKDLTPPPVPAGLSATVSGNYVTLTWIAAADGDTTEYNVYRTAGGTRERITYPAIVKQTAAYQDAVYSDGLYSYDITAKDAAGNESNPSAPVTARVYSPVIDQLATRTTLATVPVAGSNAAALASIRFETLSSAGTGSIMTTADQSGRFSADITLSAGVNTIKATATDSAGNVSNESNFVSIDFDALPDAPTGLLPSVQGSTVTLTWNQNAEPDVTGYLVYRKTGAEWSKITSSAIADITWTDAGLRNGSYQYKVTAVDALSESALSTGVTATVAVNLLSAPVNLVATAQPNGEADITWAYPEGTATGYYLYRGAAEGGPYTRITSALVAATAYRDRGLVNGTTYYYVSTAVDSFGNESDYSMWGSATAVDTTAPEKPLITTPTMSGSPIVVTMPTVTVAGKAGSGTTVELFRNGTSMGTVQATGGSGPLSIPIATYVNGASLSPDGSLMAYASDSGQIQLLDLAASIVAELTPQGYGPSWSPDGSKIVYESDATYPPQIVIHDVATNSDTPLTGELPANIYAPFSWSADGNRFTFMGYSYGPDVHGYAIWLKDLTSGELTPAVVKDSIYEHALSPDGGRLAYFQNGGLFVLDLSTGQESSIGPATDGWSLSWSPDGNRIALIETLGSVYALYVVVPNSGSKTLLAESAGDLYWTAWFPDGQRIAYSEWDNVSGLSSVKTIAADGSSVPGLVEEGLANVVYLGVTGDGQVSYVESNADTMQSVLKVVSAGGQFLFSAIALDPGENIFTAVARDASGNISAPSDAISVTRDISQQPDLVVMTDDIALYPAAPIAGERAVMSVAIRNKGQSATTEADVSVYVWNESGHLDLLVQGKAPALEPGAAHIVSAEWDSTGRTGANRIVAAVDTEQLVQESNETNNMAMLDFFVSGQEGISLATSLDATQYASDSVVKARVTIWNSGITKEGVLSVRVEDESGAEVSLLGEKAISVSYASRQDKTFTWSTGATYAGAYRVHAVLNNAAGMLAEQIAAFTIVPDTNVGTAVTTDKANYGAGEPVGVAVTLSSLGRNRIIPLLTTRLTITNEAGAVLFSNEKSTTDMLPGASIVLSSIWTPGIAPAGTYTAVLETIVDGNALPVKSANFAIRGSAVVTGTLSVSPDPVPFGSAFRAAYSLENSGNADTGAGTARVLILDPESQTVLGSFEIQSALSSNSSITGQADFSGLSNSLKTYTAVLQYVNSGNTSILASTAIIIKDMAAPTMTILSPAAETPYTSTVSYMVAASDDASGVDRIEYSRDGGSWSLLPVSDPSRGRFGTTWDPTMADNGMHTVSFRAVDRAGNSSGEMPISYEVRINRAPTAPAPAWPATGQDVRTIRPEIAVNNASDPNGDSLSYVFELYADSDLTIMIAPPGVVPEGTGTTAWTVPADLTENAVYYWRAQAFDGNLYGPWTDTASFRVNAVEDPPSVPTPTSPADKTEVATTTPVLTVINAVDPDSTSLTYNFQVALDPAFVTIVTATGGVIGGEGNTSWQVPVQLAEDVRYYWRAQADDWTVIGNWSSPAEFIVNTGNNEPSVPSINAPTDKSEVSTTAPDIVLQNSNDPDSPVITYTIELDTVKTFDSTNLLRASTIPQGSVTTLWHVDGLLDNTAYFVRARSNDGAAESNWSGVIAFFVNTVNDAPSTPVPANPSNGAGVNVFTPTLSVQNATDLDRDALTYDFEVYEDPGMATPAVASVAGVVEMQGSTSWTVSATLQENRTYYWRARAFDGELASGWTTTLSFTVNTGDEPPDAPMIVSPAEGGSVDSAMPTLTVLNAFDPDSTRLTYDFEVFYGSALIWSAPGVAEGTDGSTSATLNVGLTDNTVYSWRCRANDGQREGPWTSMTSFTVHLQQSGIKVDIEVEPETLNQKSKGNWVMVEIELPHGYKASDVDISSIRLEGTVPVVMWPHEKKKKHHEHGCGDDHREHEHGELKVKFRRSEVIAVLPAGGHVPVHITGTVAGTPFEGVDIIRVIY
ncbi:MAG: CARDB domain-containing protein [Nitrospirota bacterium]